MIAFNKVVECIIPGFIFIVLGVGLLERKDIFKLFINGVEDGLKQLYKIIPIIIAFFFLSGVVVSSNIIEIIFSKFINIPDETNKVLIVSMFKSISGSAGLSLGVEYLKSLGVESNLGIILSVILASSETTLYVVSLYLGRFKEKNVLPIVLLGFLCDILVVLLSFIIIYWHISKIMIKPLKLICRRYFESFIIYNFIYYY